MIIKKDFEIYAPSIPIVKIAKSYGIISYNKKNMPENMVSVSFINGATSEVYDSDKIINANEKLTFFEKRFEIARQLAYYLYELYDTNKLNDKSILYKNEIYSNSSNLDIYNKYAMKMLMPDNIFMKHYLYAESKFRQYYSSDYGMNIFVLEFLSEIFEVPENIVEEKIETLISDVNIKLKIKN